MEESVSSNALTANGTTLHMSALSVRIITEFTKTI
jgi:hypothetical protein